MHPSQGQAPQSGPAPPRRARHRTRSKPSEPEKAPRKHTASIGNHQKPLANAQLVGGAKADLMGVSGVPEKAVVPPAVMQENAFQAMAAGGAVVVVGLIGGRKEDSAQLIARVLQKQIGAYGSSQLHATLLPGHLTDIPGLIKRLGEPIGLRVYRDAARGLVFIHCSSEQSYISGGASGSGAASARVAYLRNLLILFLTCDVILTLEERPALNPRLLQTLHVLQSAKTALAPFLESVTYSGTSSLSARARAPRPSRRPPVGSFRGPLIALSPPPVLLLCFREENPEVETGHGARLTDSRPPGSQSWASSSPGRRSPGLERDGAGTNRATLKRKLASTLDAQARLVLRKSRLAGVYGEARVKGLERVRGDGEGVEDEPLFRLDPTRVSVMVSRQFLNPAAGLESVSRSLQEATARWVDSMILGGRREVGGFHPPGAIRLEHSPLVQTGDESVKMLLEAIWAVSAAGRLAAGGGFLGAKEAGFRSYDTWQAAFSLLLETLSDPNLKLTLNPNPNPEFVTPGSKDRLYKNEGGEVASKSANIISPKPQTLETLPAAARAALRSAFSQLHGASDPLYAYSARLCEAALPAALEAYLADLPPHYPVEVHRAHVNRAVWVMREKGGGAAIDAWLGRLQERTRGIWEAGRKSCSGRSLTGRPCVYSEHVLPGESGPEEGPERKSHSSGFWFLQACACGRTRKLREDPFEVSEAGEEWFQFEGCCSSDAARVEAPGKVSFIFARLGSAREYSLEEGLTQDGFVAGHNKLTSLDVRLPSRYRDSGIGDAPVSIIDESGGMAYGQKVDRGVHSLAEHQNNRAGARNGPVTSRSGTLTSASKPMQKTKSEAFEVRVWFGFEYECPAGHRFLHKRVVREPVKEPTTELVKEPVKEEVKQEEGDTSAQNPPLSRGKPTDKAPIQAPGRPARAGPRSRARRGQKPPGGRMAPGGLDSEEWPAIGGKALANETEWPSLASATGKGLLPTPVGRAPTGVGARRQHVGGSENAPATDAASLGNWVAKNESGGKTQEVEEFPPLSAVAPGGSKPTASKSGASNVGLQSPGAKAGELGADVSMASADVIADGANVGAVDAGVIRNGADVSEEAPVLPSVPETDLPIFRACLACSEGSPGESETGQRVTPGGSPAESEAGRQAVPEGSPGETESGRKFAPEGAQLRRVFLVVPQGSAVFGTAPRVAFGAAPRSTVSDRNKGVVGNASVLEGAMGTAGGGATECSSFVGEWSPEEQVGSENRLGASMDEAESDPHLMPLSPDSFYSLLLPFMYPDMGQVGRRQLLGATLRAGSVLRLLVHEKDKSTTETRL